MIEKVLNVLEKIVMAVHVDLYAFDRMTYSQWVLRHMR